MLLRTFSFYPSFQCLAAACKDNCCIGWEIDIDTAALQAYRGVQGAFGRRLQKNIVTEGTSHFALHEGGRCAFLNKDNLCDIILTLGEGALCKICARHPRYFTWFESVTEGGVGLACEEAARLLFASEKPLTFTETQIADMPEAPAAGVCTQALFAARDTMIRLLQTRSYTPAQRMGLALALAEAVQHRLETEDAVGIRDISRQYEDVAFQQALCGAFAAHRGTPQQQAHSAAALLALYRRMDVLDTHWAVALQSASTALGQLLAQKDAFLQQLGTRQAEYEHLLVYYIFRYFMQGSFDGDVLGKVHLAVASVLLGQLLDVQRWIQNGGTYTLADRIQLAKSYSKETEYCEANLARIAKASVDSELFQLETLLQLL